MHLSILPGLKKRFGAKAVTLEAATAYNLWAPNYDQQPGNLMLHLDDLLFSDLLGRVQVANARVVDIGCGTGRHWKKIMSFGPGSLTGIDVSLNMLDRLKQKYPAAKVQHVSNIHLSTLENETCDIIVSTLTIAHIQGLRELLSEWQRILRPGGDILLTDFHPDLLLKGGKRNFFNEGKEVVIKNYLHSVNEVKLKSFENNLYPVFTKELKIDETMKTYYHRSNALHIYERYKGSPVIYGMHLKKNYAIE